MNILVLGSDGFIGGHVVNHFRSLGHTVICADIVLKQEPGYIIINPERTDFAGIFMRQIFDVCINATGAANVQLSFEYPAMDYILNTANVYNILDSIRQYNAACKFINLSSAAVYGNPATLPVKETHEVQPLSPYGHHKWYSELICSQFHRQYGIPTISMRIFSAYGTGLKKQLFWDLHNKINSSGDHIELFGTGKESRDFIYVEDIARAIHCIIEKAEFNGNAINIASGRETNIEEVVQVFLEAFGKKCAVHFTGSSKIGDPLNWRADISVLKSLGFVPRIDIKEGVQKLVTWLKNLN